MMNVKIAAFMLAVFVFAIAVSCETARDGAAQLAAVAASPADTIEKPALKDIANREIQSVLKSANAQTRSVTGYTQKYFTIVYPNGDVPAKTGACTDVVIRSFRAAGVDLQKEVHEDMSSNFSSYPKKWRLSKPDPNIDHRRVPNLQTYLTRMGKSISVTREGSKYEPGDVVAWDLNGKGLTHIGVVSNMWNKTARRYLIIHNIGSGTRLEDRLFEWEIIGHYRYF